MRDKNLIMLALAGLFHDIGKFAERAYNPLNGSQNDKSGFCPDQDFLKSNMAVYQPLYKGNYTHKHALYTAAFIDQLKDYLPSQLNESEWGGNDSFFNLAAKHHIPETPLQWIIAIADRLSSGFDRQEFEDYNHEIKVIDYKTTRLLSIFEGINIEQKWQGDSIEDFSYRYAMKELSSDNIFPIDTDKAPRIDQEKASIEYRELFTEFITDMAKVNHKEHISLWLEHFDSLYMVYTSHIPAATVGRVVPDVSLYDHSRVTAALASSLYLFHLNYNTLNEASIRDYEAKKFLIVNGNFYGIQSFIFTEGGSTNKASAKLLRGRSFTVSLLSELAADLLCQEIGLTSLSIILNAAGKFTLIAPNTPATLLAIKTTEANINEWLVHNFYGEVSIGISYIEARGNDFLPVQFDLLWKSLAKRLDERKFNKLNLDVYGGLVQGYLDSFNNNLSKKLCPFCGKRPSHPDVETDSFLGSEKSACKLCRDHIYIGTSIVKTEHIAILKADIELKKDKLFEPIFGHYQVSFDQKGQLKNLSSKNSLLKYWNISNKSDKEGEKIFNDSTLRFINSYIPKYSAKDQNENILELLRHGTKSSKKKEEILEELINEKENPKSFDFISKMSLQFNDKDKKVQGTEALGFLKADMDNLGLIFSSGLKHKTLSRYATLSRQINNYFTIFLPQILNKKADFENIYTIFAGGDDLFLIGPWNKIIEFSIFLNKTFTEYVCGNKDITLSAGIGIYKSNEPIFSVAERVENSLMKSKNNGRNSITLFDETVSWTQFWELYKIKDRIYEWYINGQINKAMLHKFNNFIFMAKKEKELKTKAVFNIKDLECYKWKAMFIYSLVRNVGKNLNIEDRKTALDEVQHFSIWLEHYSGSMKIPLWEIIYNQR